MIRIAHNRVEVDHGIKGPVGSDPFVYRLPNYFLRFRVIAGNVHAFTRGNRGANYFDSPGVCARNQLLVRIGDVLGAARLAGSARY